MCDLIHYMYVVFFVMCWVIFRVYTVFSNLYVYQFLFIYRYF